MTARKRILFVAENVTLAQVVRLKRLASALDPARYEVVFASSAFAPMIFEGTDFRRCAIASISPERMCRRIARGARPYDEATLAGYVRQELSLLPQLQPDLVVGDLRLSLAVSAPKLGIPYAALINAYWSPHALRDGFPMPEHPIIDLVGAARVAPHFHKALPFVFEHFARPVNRLRKRHGLRPIGSLLEVLTHGDYVLYPDVPELTPVSPLPAHQRFLGLVPWAPRAPLPAFWQALDERPVIYVTLGSSGGLHALDAVLQGLSRLPVQVVLATAGRFARRHLPDNVRVAEFLPGDVAARRASLVVCNGGSTTGYQALAEGTPVLGLPFNLDQYLAMDAIERAGAGLTVRSGSATPLQVERAAARLLEDRRAHQRARELSCALRALDARSRFAAFVRDVVDAPRAVTSTLAQID